MCVSVPSKRGDSSSSSSGGSTSDSNRRVTFRKFVGVSIKKTIYTGVNKQDTQRMYNVTLRHVRVTIFAMEQQ
jgi:hypothetical protein